jgi:hypothetical protein
MKAQRAAGREVSATGGHEDPRIAAARPSDQGFRMFLFASEAVTCRRARPPSWTSSGGRELTT